MQTYQIILLYIGVIITIPGVCFGRIPWVILATTAKPKIICFLVALVPFFSIAKLSDYTQLAANYSKRLQDQGIKTALANR